MTRGFRSIAAATVILLMMGGRAAAIAQNIPCANDSLDADGGSAARGQCERRVERVAEHKAEPAAERTIARAAERAVAAAGERNPLAQPRVVTPPGAIMKKVLPPDPNKEERLLRERLHRALRNNERRKPATSPECQAIVQQIADQQPMLRSLRTEARALARENVRVLTSQFREREC